MAHGDIANCYDNIFSSDPLLLKDSSQESYSESLLTHLLLKRTLNAFSPMLVKLDDANDRKIYWTRHAWPVLCPPEDVVRRYKERRLTRTPLDKDDRDKLEAVALVSRAEMTEGRKSYPSHDAAIKQLETSESKIDNRLRIAAVGYRVQISKVPNDCRMGEELHALATQRKRMASREPIGEIELGRTIARSEKAEEEWETAIISHVETALDRKCHFIVLPEFALPPKSMDRTPIEQALHARSGKEGTADHFIFAGSRHEGGSNRGLVLAKLQQKACAPWWHHKVASARGLGENIFGPFGTKRPSYAARFDIAEREKPTFPIDIAICYDSFDPTVFLSLVLQSIVSTDGEMRPRIMLVPSFNTSKDFVALLRDLSFLSRSTVIYVNGLHGDAKMYICGFAVSDFTRRDRIDDMRRQLAERAGELNKQRQSLLDSTGLSPEQAKDLNGLTRRAQAAELLEKRLRDLQGSQALDCVITLQGNPNPEAVSGRFDPSDLLFYNIDMGLLNALVGFRADYFGSDLFLPIPFRYDSLREAAVELRAKVARDRKLEKERWQAHHPGNPAG